MQYFPAVVLTGARQVGKTTMIEHCVGKEIKTITFDPVIDVGGARAEPEYFLQNNPPPIFLDEIQYAPELLGPLKRRIDQDRKNGQYILSGSQNPAVLKNVAESMAGRAAVLNLMAMSYREINRQLEKPALFQKWLTGDTTLAHISPMLLPDVFVKRAFAGGYPGILGMPDDLYTDYWSSYMQTYIERDVRRVAEIRDLQNFGKFIKLLAALSSCEINFSQLGRELSIDRNSAENWTSIARATYQWYEIPAFSRNPVRKIAGKAKGVFADTGFLCYLLSINSPAAVLDYPNHGRIFETYILLEILKNLQESGLRESMYHFRTYSGAEVDCIIEHDGYLYLIEIKATTQPGKKHTTGFQSFKECFPAEKIARELIICSVERPAQISDTCIAVPWWIL